jgi:hypothetical protein
MKRAIVLNTDSKIIGQHQCNSWEECLEWIDSFINWNGLSRTAGHICEKSQMTVWVEERK